MTLSVPDIKQGNSHSCGPTVFRCLAEFWGVKGRVPISTPLDGSHPASIVAAFRKAGLRCLAGEADIAVLTSLLKLGRPVICLVQRGGDGHYVVVTGCARGRVHLHDPIDGARSERVDEFVANWADVDVFGTAYHRFILCPFL